MTLGRADLDVAFAHFSFTDYVAALVNELHRLVDLELIRPDFMEIEQRGRLEETVATRTFTTYRTRDPRSALSALHLRSILRGSDADLLHVQQSGYPLPDLAYASVGTKPIVFTVHDPRPHPGDGDHLPGSHATMRRLMQRADRVICHTSKAADELMADGLSIKPDVIPHGELGSVTRRFGEVAREPTERHTVLFFGRRWPYKGFDVLVAAMPRVLEACPDAKVIVAGRGEPIADHFPSGVPHWCEVHDRYVSDAETVEFHRRAAVVALPYREATQSGAALLAYGLHRPVVASSVGGLAELVDPGEDGLLVAPEDPAALADGLIALLSDDKLWLKLQTGQRHRCATDLSQAHIAKRHVEIYESLSR